MSDSQTNFTLTDPAIEPIDLNRMDEFLFSAMLRASIHLGGSHTPLQLSRMVRKSLLTLSLEKDLTFDLAYAKEFTPVSKLSPLALQIYEMLIAYTVQIVRNGRCPASIPTPIQRSPQGPRRSCGDHSILRLFQQRSLPKAFSRGR